MNEITKTNKAIVHKEKSWDEIVKALGSTDASPSYPDLKRSVGGDIPDMVEGLNAIIKNVNNKLPDQYGKLTDDERGVAITALAELSKLRTAIVAVEDQVKALVHGHLDAVYEGDVTERHEKNGWLLAEDSTSFVSRDTNRKLIRTATAPKMVATLQGLAQLEEEGTMTHAEYLRATKPVRIVDHKALAVLVDKREDEFLDRVFAVSKREPPKVSIRVTDNK